MKSDIRPSGEYENLGALCFALVRLSKLPGSLLFACMRILYHSFLDVLIRFHASTSIRYNARTFVIVRVLSPRFVPVR